MDGSSGQGNEPPTKSYDWGNLRRRIQRIEQHAAFSDAVFGSSCHMWQLEPPLSTFELSEIENQLRVRLPEEYRSFLLQCSRGGAGPYHGLFSLTKRESRWRWLDDDCVNDLEHLDMLFPHTEAFNPADGLPEQPEEHSFDSTQAYIEAEDRWQDQCDDVVYSPQYSKGLLYLCHLGCALRHALVITGPARGQMWEDNTPEWGGFRPLTSEDGKSLTFASWYIGWLDGAEQKLGLASKSIEGPEFGRVQTI